MSPKRFQIRRLLGLAGLAAACVIPDRDILVEGEFDNRGAVRIVERLNLGPAVEEACSETRGIEGGCPQVPATLPTGFIQRAFCVCPEPQVDGRALGEFQIYAEDPDRDEEGEPEDDLFAAFLLDYDPFQDEAADAAAYSNYLGTRAAEPVFSSEYENAIERPDPLLRSWRVVGLGGFVDLCNDNEGTRLTPGLHTLTVVATDREWFTPILRDAEGKPMLDENGNVIELEPRPGVPDLASGATFDTATYMFECGEGEMCDCTMPGG